MAAIELLKKVLCKFKNVFAIKEDKFIWEYGIHSGEIYIE